MEFLHQKWFIDAMYLVSVFFFILGIKKMSSPRTARKGNFYSMIGMLIAIAITLMDKKILSFEMILVGVVAGGLVGVIWARIVPMTSMPETVAIFNGFGGLASTLVVLGEYYGAPTHVNHDMVVFVTLVLSVLVGCVTFTGSLVAFLKLNTTLPGRPMMVSLSKFLNILFFAAIAVLSVFFYQTPLDDKWLLIVVAISLILGLTLVLPIGGGDMPVVVSLLNSYSGIAVSMTGFVLKNNALIVVGSLVGASGIILTNIMCKAMNRSLTNVLFGGFGASDGAAAGGDSGSEIQGNIKTSSPEDISMLLDVAEAVSFVPGYGMATSQAQHIVKKLTDNLIKRGVKVTFGIHPVAGRMPGHMNVLLAESGVEYDLLLDLDQANDTFANTDVVIIVGANDVVNPAARHNKTSPIYGMPILNVDEAKTVVVLKRSIGNVGYAGIQNELFYKENTLMVLGDAKKSLESMLSGLNELD